MAAFGLLAAGIAHEVGNPLAGISSLIQMIRRRDPDRYVDDKLALAESQLGRIQRTIRDLIDYSRPASTLRSRVRPAEVVDEALGIAKYYQRTKERAITTDVPADLAPIRGVRDHLTQVAAQPRPQRHRRHRQGGADSPRRPPRVGRRDRPERRGRRPGDRPGRPRPPLPALFHDQAAGDRPGPLRQPPGGRGDGRPAHVSTFRSWGGGRRSSSTSRPTAPSCPRFRRSARTRGSPGHEPIVRPGFQGPGPGRRRRGDHRLDPPGVPPGGRATRSPSPPTPRPPWRRSTASSPTSPSATSSCRDADGLDLLDRLLKVRPELLVLIITAYATVETAVAAFRRGAHDYLMKPVIFDELLAKLDRLMRFRLLTREVQALRRQLHATGRDRDPGRRRSGDAGGEDPDPQDRPDPEQRPGHRRIGDRQGTGRPRPPRPGGSTPTPRSWRSTARRSRMISSRISFSATSGAPSRAPIATGSACSSPPGGAGRTVFLDEIGELPLATQAKLLRAIEAKEVLPVGANRPEPVAARVVAATNKDLGAEVAAGRFRADLYYRLNVVAIPIPAPPRPPRGHPRPDRRPPRSPRPGPGQAGRRRRQRHRPPP